MSSSGSEVLQISGQALDDKGVSKPLKEFQNVCNSLNSCKNGVALRSTQVRLTCVAGVTRKAEETKGTPALAFSLSLFLSGPTLKTSPIS